MEERERVATVKAEWTVKALAAARNQSIRDLAHDAGIDPGHLYLVSCNRATMTGTDLIKLAFTTDKDPRAIITN